MRNSSSIEQFIAAALEIYFLPTKLIKKSADQIDESERAGLISESSVDPQIISPRSKEEARRAKN